MFKTNLQYLLKGRKTETVTVKNTNVYGKCSVREF